MRNICIVSYNCNPVLKKHLELILSADRQELLIDFSVKNIFKGNVDYFIYNVSVLNVLIGLVTLLMGKKVIYHLHDPVPHSGWKNPFIFVLQLILVFVSEKILVFDDNLHRQLDKYYVVRERARVSIVPHGSPVFKYIQVLADDEKITVGFFGRNMRYKRVDRLLKIATSNPTINFLLVGSGYSLECVPQNVRIIEGFIEPDIYYSLMIDVDAVILPYDRISFSGVLSDALSFKKPILASNEILELYADRYKLYSLNAINSFPKALTKPNPDEFLRESSWRSYYTKLISLT
jgi:glycosyltransferase involved in cell wall biosynthesis